jgi:hypothetical protein
VQLLENVKDRGHLVDQDVDERRLSKWVLNKIGCEAVDWIHLAQ